MLKVNPIQTNFASGEISPQLFGRTDVERYFGAAATLENFIVRHSGGIERRLGSKNVGRAATQTADHNVRLLDFVFSRTEAVCLEISAGKFRFIQNGAFVQSGGSPYAVTTLYGTATVIPYTNSEVNELQVTQSADVLFITHPNHPPATLSRYGSTDWRYEVPEFDYGPYLDQESGDQNFSLTVMDLADRAQLVSSNATEFESTELDDLVEYPLMGSWVLGRVTQLISDNTIEVEPLEDRCLAFSKEVYSPGLYTGWDGTNSVPLYNESITGTDVQVAFSNTGVLTQEHVGNYVRFMDKYGAVYWMLVDSVEDIVKMGAYGIIAKGDILSPQVPTGIVTRRNRDIDCKLVASDTNFFDLATDVPRLFRLVLGGQVVHARTYSHGSNSTYQVRAKLNRPLPRSREGLAVVDDGTTNDWNAGAWFPGNYPSTVFFHEERLGFAGTYYEPQTGWLSKTADFFNFATTDEKLRVMDDSAVTFTVASDTVNQALWCVSKRALLVGTAGGEWAVSASGGSDTALSPTNAMVQTQSSYGSEFAKPILAGKSLIYLQRGGRKLRKMEYDYQSDGMVSLDLTVFAEHVLKAHGDGKQLAYQLLPESILYVRLGDGQIAALTYEEDQQVYAWSRFILGGDGFVESIACVPESGKFRLYCVVRRTINGSLVRTVEVIDPEFRPTSTTDYSGMFFLDNHVSGGALGSATVSGLSDFAGCTVNALIDNRVYHGLTVSVGGSVTLPAVPATRYAIGFGYTSTLQTVPLEAQAPAGTGQGKVKRIDHLGVRVINSINFSHGQSLSSLREEVFGTGDAIPMVTDDRRIPADNGFTTGGQYFITQSKSYPLTVLSLMPEIATYQ